MALIKCPECGKEVSDKAETCIHCGYPIKKELEEHEKIQQADGIDIDASTEPESTGEVQEESDEDRKRRIRNIAITIVVVVVVIIVLVAVMEYVEHSYTRAQKKAQQSYQEYQKTQSDLDSLERQKSAVDSAIDSLESNK